MKTKFEYLHSWYLFVASLLGLLFLLVSSSLWLNALLVLVLHLFYFKNGLRPKDFFRNVIFAVIFSSSIFALNWLWPADRLQSGEDILISGLKTSIKLLLLVLTSMASAGVINYTKVVLYLVIHKGLKVLWGYPVIIALNSILLFKEEYQRIKLNGQLRNLGLKGKLGVLFPLLVFAIRHSQRGSLSLVTRGLNPHKNFYFNYSINPHDRLVFRFFLLFYLLIALGALALKIYFR